MVNPSAECEHGIRDIQCNDCFANPDDGKVGPQETGDSVIDAIASAVEQNSGGRVVIGKFDGRLAVACRQTWDGAARGCLDKLDSSIAAVEALVLEHDGDRTLVPVMVEAVSLLRGLLVLPRDESESSSGL